MRTNDVYAHLGLTEWPFSITPTPRGTMFMADRADLREEIGSLLRRLARRPQSSVHLMWAWFGAGKTHTLKHMCNLSRSSFSNLHPIYTEFPKSAKGFIDIFRQAAAAWELDEFADSYLEVATSAENEQHLRDLGLTTGGDIPTALRILVAGTAEQQQILRRWFLGERIPAATLRQAGPSRALQSAEDATKVITTLASVYGRAKQISLAGPGRTILVIDEFQRISQCRADVRSEVSTAIHSLLNMCPNHLTIFLSFSGRPEKSWPDWLSPELADRIGIERVLLLPPLRTDEAKIFMADILREYRPDNYEGTEFFPFDEQTIEAVIDRIDKEYELKPRALMQYFSAILEEADGPLEDGKKKTITPAFAEDCLRGRIIQTAEEEE